MRGKKRKKLLRHFGPAGCQEAPRPNVVQLLDNEDHKWSGIVRDYEDSQELTRQYMMLNDKAGKADVPESNDFPEDKQAQKELARQLFEAILEVDPATADHMHSKRIRALSNFEVELLAWELLFAARRAQDGILGLAKWSPKSSQNYERCENFRERFELVKEGCRKSKSVVHNMLLASFTTRMAAAPVQECKMKRSNKMINDKRGIQMKQYRDIMTDNPHNSAASSSSKRGRDDDTEETVENGTDNKRRKSNNPAVSEMDVADLETSATLIDMATQKDSSVLLAPPLQQATVWGSPEALGPSMPQHTQDVAAASGDHAMTVTAANDLEEFGFMDEWFDFGPGI